MEETIIKLAEELITVKLLTEKINDKTFWIEKAKNETNFVPSKEDWISVEVTKNRIIVNVYGLNANVYWINGHWTDNRFSDHSTSLEKMLAEMRAW